MNRILDPRIWVLGIVGVAFILLSLGVAFADEAACKDSLASNVKAAADAGVPNDKIIFEEGADFAKRYSDALGFGVPSDSNPRGVLFVEFPQAVFIALVEQNNCIRYSQGIPIDMHRKALAKAKASV